MRVLGRNQRDIKRENTSNLLRLLHLSGGLSRTELAKRMNLSKMAISNISNDLIQLGYLETAKSTSPASNGGPTPTLLTITPEKFLAIGVSITLEVIECAIADISQGLLYSESYTFTSDKDRSDINRIVTHLISSVTNKVKVYSKSILGIGVAIAGLVDTRQLYVDDRPEHIGDIDQELVKHLENTFSVPVVLKNNMSASAIAEYYFGSERGTSSFIYVGIGDGVGAGIITNDRLVEGNSGFAGEIGHTTIANNGLACRCNNIDCAELYVSSTALLKAANVPDWNHLLELKERHPKNVSSILENYSSYLETLLVNTIHMYDPSCVIIGGHITTLGERFFSDLSHSVNRRVIWQNQANVPIVRSVFGMDASIAGSYAIIFDMFFNGQIDFLFDEVENADSAVS